jgi:UDP-4-amino-4,6-dideoxy-N-acetyl-beta-L-altrosamine N-acetyltransferase
MSYRLRLLRASDLETVMHWRMRPEVTRYMYSDPQLTLQGQQAWFDKISVSPRDRVWIIELLDGARAVGLLSLSDIDPVHRRCAWAYYLGDTEVRGAGLAKSLELNVYAHVFDTLGLNKLWCEVLAFNDRVVSLHEKFGSQVEGRMRQHICKDGQFHDVVRMGIVRADWPAVKARFNWTPVDIEEPAWAVPLQPLMPLMPISPVEPALPA